MLCKLPCFIQIERDIAVNICSEVRIGDTEGQTQKSYIFKNLIGHSLITQVQQITKASHTVKAVEDKRNVSNQCLLNCEWTRKG